MSEEKTKLNCSFCGKEQAKVKKLIAGPNTYICNECVDLCNDILVEEDKNDENQTPQISKPKEIFSYLDESFTNMVQFEQGLAESLQTL